jgi:ankyrin repeat protein
MLVTIRDGADINTMKGVTTALMLAAETRHDLVARLLIKSGATVNANTETDHGMEMLANAVNGGIEWLVCLLIDKGADVNVRIDKDNNTVLMHAIRSLHDTSSVVQLILEKGAEVDAMNNWGHTALWIAASMIHGGTNDAEINSSNYSALWAAADMTRARNARLLIENGANVNTKANNGWTPLMWAARGGIDWLVRLLIEKGADINARNNDGDTALMWAELEGHKHVVRLLKGHAD